jgi:HSP90 family molecular chaperone
LIPTASPLDSSTSTDFITDDLADMMPINYNFVGSITESNDPPLNVSRSKRDQGRQLEALTDGEDSDNRQHEGVHNDHHQKFTLPNHGITCPMNATYKSIAMGEQNHEVNTCLIMFDEAHKLYGETNNDNVSNKSATEVTVMMNNTATLRPAYSLNATVNAEDEIDQAEMLEDMKEKKIAPLDASFHKIRVPSDDENMHENTQEDEKNPAVKAAKTTLYAKSKLAINTRALTLKTYQEDGSRAKTVMTMALHHPTDRQDQTTSPALTVMRKQVDDKDQTEVKMVSFATEGEEGITKCLSTWPAHFAAVTTAALHSFLHQQG